MPLTDPSGRIGNPRLKLDADTLVADESDYRDEPYLFLDPTETDLAIADNLREFLETEVERFPTLSGLSPHSVRCGKPRECPDGRTRWS